MELVVRLGDEKRVVYESGIDDEIVPMARAAGLYAPIWEPGGLGITRSGQLVAPLVAGLKFLRADPARFSAFDTSIWFGRYSELLRFTKFYLDACIVHPELNVSIGRWDDEDVRCQSR